MHSNILLDIALCIITATVFAFVAKWLRQPLLLGYIVAGEVDGRSKIASPEEIETISELGLILLLFMIGLEIDLKMLRKSGAGVVAAGIGQFVICTGLGLTFAPFLGSQFGQENFAPLYLAVTVGLSSTLTVV